MQKLQKTKQKRIQTDLTNKTTWRDEYLFDAWEFARNGMNNTDIAKALGTDTKTFKRWCDRVPLLGEGLAHARERARANAVGGFFEYIYRHLPKDLRELWEELKMNMSSQKGKDRNISIFRSQNKRDQQHLFLHAYVSRKFNASAACRILGLPVHQLESWKQEPDFRRLMDEVHFHKKCYFEAGLFNLVEKGNAKAILFVNERINREQYGKRVEIVHDGKVQVEHTHKVVLLKELPNGLSHETRLELLEAIRDANRLTDETADQGQSEIIDIGNVNVDDSK